MAQIDPQLLSIEDVVPIMEDLFLVNEKLVYLIGGNIETLKKKNADGDNIFDFSPDETTSIANILNYTKRIIELKDSYENIKLGNVYKTEFDKFNKLDNKFHDLIKKYLSFLQAFRYKLKQTKEFTEIEKQDIESNFGKKLYETMDMENNILKIIVKVLENNVTENTVLENKKIIANHVCEVDNSGQILIDSKFSKIRITPKLAILLRKLLVLNTNGSYALVQTKKLKNKYKKNDDDFRKTLARLRKETKKLFTIINTKNEDGESCYVIVFKN